jgi:phosphoribosylanthranilate isomerase
MRTRIKICGITRIEDALAAATAGADALGLVFVEQSPRHLSPAEASILRRELPPFVSVVALFVNADAAAVWTVIEQVRPDVLQFHGEETPEFCSSFAFPYLKAARVRPGMDLLQYAARYEDAQGLLLDAYTPGVHGGTGERFDWSLIPGELNRPIVLAGGLEPGNVGEAVRGVRPWAVDVSSGVEAAKGIKDAAKMAAFIREVRNADV